ncbi:SUMF1/EgtB/PvdO family nonheme iron enzyme [Lishizhenia sp.]|uniref:type IX secretion system lipoprotein PorK/GldK n=1 Tax=Lishizhenia sp. TaxID=2497594 RepID=UPI00299DE39F|nr:SUMF1/EgtB/PvdO family nonheme iron enzyme [Lishizhenia sp.]MDX1445871.1 SUMF1/EgtB/PvdO family nonheme iron enzyme [Lishizhenia sp.]
MKKLLLLGFVSAILISCNTRTGHLTGVMNRGVYYPEIPLGMVYIPSGSYTMGQSDQDVPFMHQTVAKTVSVPAFYMDQTEITNNEYRQFVYWVRDSIAREKIYEGLSDDEEAEQFINYQDMYFDEGALEWVDYDPSDRIFSREQFGLNWDKEFSYENPDIVPLVIDMYYPQSERYYKRKEIDTRKLRFKYYWIDMREAARRGEVHIKPDGKDYQGAVLDEDHRTLKTPEHPFTKDPQGKDLDLGYFNKKGQDNAIRGHENRQRFIIDEEIQVYPDTLVWIRDFTYSYNDDQSKMYFWHVAYDNYPVVGITWTQAKAFNVWRTQLLNSWLVSMGEVFVSDFRLPNESEWERAARGDLDGSPYPWGGPYIRNESGCFLGNFKPMRGRYFQDGGFYTVKAYSYNPNGWGLYCMAGNVAEWCETAYDESMYEFSNDLSSDYRYDAMDWDPPSQKRKVIRGGSWKDIGYYLQTSTRTYEYQDTAKSYIGTRSVQTHLGRGGRDFDAEGGEELDQDLQLR